MKTEMNEKNPSSIKQIQGTNDSSSISKKSTENFGYFKDAYLSEFVIKQSRRSPLIHRGYYIRFKAVDFIIRQFLHFFPSTEKVLQVISLGAGFDTTFFRLNEEFVFTPDVAYFEIDFEDVVKRKATMIKQSESLQKLIPNSDPRVVDGRTGPGYWLLACDLNSIENLSTALTKAHLDWSAPTLVLSECAITYMPVEASNAVIAYFASAFSNAMFAVYEQVRPHDSFGKVMQKHFESLHVPLQSIRAFPNLASQKLRYTDRGWESSVAIDMLQFYHFCTPQQEKERIENIEPFDEYEEWHLVCSHYTLVSSGKGHCVELINALYPKRMEEIDVHIGEFVVRCNQVATPVFLKRYGHCSAILGDQIVTIGGFGETDSGHQRFNDFVVTDMVSSSSKCVPFSSTEKLLTRMYASIFFLDHHRVLIFGGRWTPKSPCNVQTCVFEMCEDILELSPIRPKEGPSLRWRHAACITGTEDIPHLFVFGGRDSENILGDCWSLNTSTWNWKEIEATKNKPSARMSASMCCLDGNVFLVGGLKNNMQISSSVYKFSRGEWQKLVVCGMPAKYSATVTGCKNKLIFVGGYSKDSTGLGILDLISNAYNEVKMTVSSHLLHGHSVVIHNNTLVVLGGGGNCFSFGTYLNESLLVIPISELMK